MYQGLEEINDNANYLVCVVIYDPSLDQRILRKEQENILKLKIKPMIGWFIYDIIQRQKHRFSPTLPQTLNKRNISGILVNNKARVK